MRLLPAILLLALSAQAQTFGTTTKRINYTDIGTSQFATGGPAQHCGNETEPVPLDTPNPLFSRDAQVVVDVVIGWDGKVYSAYVLESTRGISEDYVVRSMRSWRFRPATCNGVASTVEARVFFTRR